MLINVKKIGFFVCVGELNSSSGAVRDYPRMGKGNRACRYSRTGVFHLKSEDGVQHGECWGGQNQGSLRGGCQKEPRRLQNQGSLRGGCRGRCHGRRQRRRGRRRQRRRGEVHGRSKHSGRCKPPEVEVLFSLLGTLVRRSLHPTYSGEGGEGRKKTGQQ